MQDVRRNSTACATRCAATYGALVALLLAVAFAIPPTVSAQRKARGRSETQAATGNKSAKRGKSKASRRGGKARGRSGARGENPAARDDGEVVGAGDDKVKVFKFTGLDIAGQLKSPQLLYFLNRMRAQFDRPKLPHRSFVPELQRAGRGEDF